MLMYTLCESGILILILCRVKLPNPGRVSQAKHPLKDQDQLSFWTESSLYLYFTPFYFSHLFWTVKPGSALRGMYYLAWWCALVFFWMPLENYRVKRERTYSTVQSVPVPGTTRYYRRKYKKRESLFPLMNPRPTHTGCWKKPREYTEARGSAELHVFGGRLATLAPKKSSHSTCIQQQQEAL